MRKSALQKAAIAAAVPTTMALLPAAVVGVIGVGGVTLLTGIAVTQGPKVAKAAFREGKKWHGKRMERKRVERVEKDGRVVVEEVEVEVEVDDGGEGCEEAREVEQAEGEVRMVEEKVRDETLVLEREIEALEREMGGLGVEGVRGVRDCEAWTEEGNSRIVIEERTFSAKESKAMDKEMKAAEKKEEQNARAAAKAAAKEEAKAAKAAEKEAEKAVKFAKKGKKS